VDSCLDDQEFPVSAEDGMRAVELAEAAARSIDEQRRIEL